MDTPHKHRVDWLEVRRLHALNMRIIVTAADPVADLAGKLSVELATISSRLAEITDQLTSAGGSAHRAGEPGAQSLLTAAQSAARAVFSCRDAAGSAGMSSYCRKNPNT